MQQKVKKVVLAGGPGTGKSSILLSLEFLGEHVVQEAATDFIRIQQARGIANPWEHWDNFLDGIFKLQTQREKRVVNEAKRIIFDRGLFDLLSYIDQSHPLYQKVLDVASACNYHKVFVIEPLDFTNTNGVRRENREEALVSARKIEQLYRDFGYDPIMIKKGMLDQRVQQILGELENE